MRPLIRAMNAIRSCRTRSQIAVAEKYAELALKTVRPEIRKPYADHIHKMTETAWRRALRN